MAFELAIINCLLAYDLLAWYSIHVIVHAIGCRNAFPFCFLFVEQQITHVIGCRKAFPFLSCLFGQVVKKHMDDNYDYEPCSVITFNSNYQEANQDVWLMEQHDQFDKMHCLRFPFEILSCFGKLCLIFLSANVVMEKRTQQKAVKICV